MATVEIHRVGSDGTRAAEFIRLPYEIYRGYSHYVPWPERGMRRIIAGRHPYFEHSQGEFVVARRNGRPVGRVAFLEPDRYNRYQNRRDGRFFFYETIDDRDVSDALLTYVLEEARRRGLERVVGPQGFSGFAGSGILVQGFDRTATMTMMPYHLSYYGPSVEDAGFEKFRDFYSAEVDAQRSTLPEKYRRAAQTAKKRDGFTVTPLRTRRDLRRMARSIGDIVNNSWEEHDDFTPMTDREIAELTDDLLLVSDPSLVKIVRRDDEIAGFVLGFPDVSVALIRAGGRLTPLHILRIMWEKRRTKRYVVNGLGILPQYRRTGAMPLLFATLADTLTGHGVEEAELVQIAETTDLMMSNIEKLSAKITKTHRVYQQLLT